MTRTAESLKRMALRTGAVVELDGQAFNAGRAVAPYAKPVAVPPAPKPTAAPAPVAVDHMPAVLAQMEAMVRAVELNAGIGQSIQRAVADIKPAPPPQKQAPKKWTWTFHRDNRGLIQRIEASSE